VNVNVQKRIGKGDRGSPELRRSLAVAAARRLWFRAASRRISARVLGGRVWTRGCLNRRAGVVEGLGFAWESRSDGEAVSGSVRTLSRGGRRR
jgi:hypothetical protein